MSQEEETFVIPSNPADRKKIKIMLTEMTHIMESLKMKRDEKSEIAAEIQKQFGIPKKIANKLAQTMYKNNYADVMAENEDFDAAYQIIVGSTEVHTEAE